MDTKTRITVYYINKKMEKEYYKNLAEKYFAGDITEAEISELAGWRAEHSRGPERA